MLILSALTSARLRACARRADAFFDRFTEELFEDPGALWKRHRGTVVVLATSAIFSGLATLIVHRLAAPF